MTAAVPRIALLGFAIECNRFAPVATREDFASDVDLSGDAIIKDARLAASMMLPDLPGFVAEMDRTGAWMPIPLRVAQAQPGGPVDAAYFAELMADFEAGLRRNLPLDAVYVSSHGAALAVGSDDPDGEIYAMIRRVVGPDVPVIGVFDLHANVSQRLVDAISVYVGYRENPHTDIRERGIEAARHMREALGGTRTRCTMVKTPIVSPPISLLTATGPNQGPYADLIQHGQTRVGGPVMNVSVMAGFAFADSPLNGLCTIVTVRGDDVSPGRAVALEIGTRAWSMRARFKRTMTSLDAAVRRAVETGLDPSKPKLILADCADNPGGGGRGNTMYLLKALKAAGAQHVLFGLINDPALAAEAHRLGEGASFRARFNNGETQSFSQPWEADASVVKLHDGPFVGRRGLIRGVASDLGPAALLDLGGIRVAVITLRQQCLDPMQLEVFDPDILAGARTLCVKSRGHFRAGFDQFTTPENIIEVDNPGLTSPNLGNFDWTKLPRPVYPLDEDATWTVPNA